MDFTLTPATTLIGSCALIALTTITIVWASTRGARARASEKARAWSEIKRPDWEARAARKRDARASGALTEKRLRRALMIAVAIVALAATNLSAHATINAMARIGLHSLDTAISVIVVFEMFLAILGALSWWHMHRGTGFNRYELGVWLMASLMGGIAWWGGGTPVFALWPLLAAVAWHVVITFGRDHKPSALVTWWRLKRGNATSRDASTIVTERLITRIVNNGYAANEGAKLLRSARSRAFDRAWAEADALGILTPEVRARIQTRTAARYAGASALARDAVMHMSPWNERAQSARPARAVRPVSAPPAPVVEMSAHVPDDARALTETSAPAIIASAHDSEDVIAAINVQPDTTVPVIAKEWMQKFVEVNGKLPTRNELGVAMQKSPGHAARWITPVRKELGLS